MHTKKPYFLLGAGRCLLLLVAALMITPLAVAEERQVVGLITHLVTGDSGSPESPQLVVAIKPAVQGCFYGLMVIPASQAELGQMMLSVALAAQAGNNAVSITYDTANSCIIKQIVALTP